MSRITLEFDGSEPLELLDALRQQKAAQTAAVRAMKKTRTSMKRAVAKRTGLTQSEVLKRLRGPRGYVGPVRVVLEVDDNPLSLTKFKVTQLKRAGVRAKIGGRTKKFRGAFIATMPTGHRGVFRRKKKTRSRKGMPWGTPELPIREMYAPWTVADIFGDEWEQHGLAVFREHFAEELFRALRFGRGRRR